ncbi:hypothetical protein [Kitasatospora sp. NPDC056531]
MGRITELRGKRSQGTAHTTAAKPAEGEAEARADTVRRWCG